MNIPALVKRGPGPMLEFIDEPDADTLAEQIAAFANNMGGTIVVGMDPQGRVRPNVADDVEPLLARALLALEPPLRAGDLPEFRLEEGPWGQVAAIAIKPTSYQVSVGGKAIYVRTGALNVRLTPEQVARVASSRAVAAFEEDYVAGATLDDFDDEIIAEYQRNRIKRGPRGESFTRAELLRDVGAIDAEGRPTVAGMLLFGKHPQHFFPQVGVVLVRFRGTSMREVVASDERYSRRVDVVGPAARVVEHAWQVLLEETQRGATTNGMAREEHYEYPPEAMREALVNAICHRDYSITGQRVEVRLFDDRIEIISPGRLPGHITLENMRDEHYSRNPRLVRGLHYWGYIEELGQGVDIIYEALGRAHQPPPDFRETERSLVVTLRKAAPPEPSRAASPQRGGAMRSAREPVAAPAAEPPRPADEAVALQQTAQQVKEQTGREINLRQARAIRFLETHERITNRDYQDLCPDVTPETLRLDLADLVQKSLLLSIGDKRGRYYVRK